MCLANSAHAGALRYNNYPCGRNRKARRARLDKIVDNNRRIIETRALLNSNCHQLGFEFVAMRQDIHEIPAVILEWLNCWLPMNKLARNLFFGQNLRKRFLQKLGLRS